MIDSEFEDRVAAMNWMLTVAGEPREVVGGKRVVEIGSGFGAGAIACARNGAAQYLGIDPEPFGSAVIQLDGSDNAYRDCYERAATSVDRRRILFLQGMADDWPAGGFDVCLVADVLEHVDDPRIIAASAWRLLRPGGIAITSTCPLYFSAPGHHLPEVFKDRPWGHLYEDFSPDDLISRTSNYALSQFHSLNRTTHAELVDVFASVGFEISKQRVLPHHEGADFSKVRHLIKAEYLECFSDEVFEQSLSQLVVTKP